MKTRELRAMSVEDLNKTLRDARENLFNLRFRHATGQLEKVSLLPATRREIARILTILTEKGA
ncbi:MAG: 50S ribosomal protein L29 [Deltaproteobacteria bacterium]|jgi:large subunit ribosomal protein L29|nr:50S ribosomal protein L29 [Deltaproteobacteria bacterium]